MVQLIAWLMPNHLHTIKYMSPRKSVCQNLIKRMSFATRQIGPANSLHYRLFLEDTLSGKVVSPFHDVPLWTDQERGIANMVVEIPRWTCAKMEVCKEELMNPIKQDTKKDALRYVRNIFPHHGYPWNYGALPQTWECPECTDQSTNCKGDNDPIDAVEIGSAVIASGTVKAVKVVGITALIDEGETDWKVIVIDVNDPLAAQINDIDDVKRHCPELLEATHCWFRDYKVPEGKSRNEFAFDGRFLDRQFALKVIAETHEMWHKLIRGEVENTHQISLANRRSDNSHTMSPEQEKQLPPSNIDPPAAAPVDPAVHKQVFVN